jgi:flagellar hook assembly protein FlgD
MTDVTLDVYSASGRLVRRLVQRQVSPGTRVVLWDGTNQDGVMVPSGIYFYQLRGGSEVQTRKMTLLK